MELPGDPPSKAVLAAVAGAQMAELPSPLLAGGAEDGGPVMGVALLDYGRVTPAIAAADCAGCGAGCPPGNPGMEFFRPCECPRVWHRECFRRWRAGWIRPRNYWRCPGCGASFAVERVAGAAERNAGRRRRIVRRFRWAVLRLWLGLVAAGAASVAGVAGIAYAADPSRNVPVAVEFMLTSVVHGFPGAGSAAGWRREFQRPDVRVWPSYTLLGAVVTAVAVLVVLGVAGCALGTRRRRDDGCCDSLCRGGAGGGDPCGPCWWGPCWLGPGDACRCNGGDCCGGSDCSCGGGGGNDAAAALLVVAVVVIVLVLVSAVFVLVGFAVKKTLDLHRGVAEVLISQAEELEGETIVLGVGESMRNAREV